MIKKLQLTLCLLSAFGLSGTAKAQSGSVTTLDRSGWQLSVSSACDDGNSGQIGSIIDGNVNTYWHSNWGGNNAVGGSSMNSDQAFIVDLGEMKEFNGFGFVPRVSNSNGFWKQCEIYVSNNPFSLEFPFASHDDAVAKVTAFKENNTPSITAAFPVYATYEHRWATNTTLSGRYVLVLITDSQGDNNGRHGTCAEFNLYKADDPKDIVTLPLISGFDGLPENYLTYNETSYNTLRAKSLDEINAEVNAYSNPASIVASQPEDGHIYRFISALPGFEANGSKKAIYNNNGTLGWQNLSETSANQLWTLTTNGSGFTMSAYGKTDANVSASGNDNNATHAVGASSSEITFTTLGAGQYNITAAGGNAFHCGGHSSGAGSNGDIIRWPGEQSSASSWYIQDVTDEFSGGLPVTLTYVFKEGGVEKARDQVDAISGQPFPAYGGTALPDFVSATLPEGVVPVDGGIFDVPVTVSLPFTASTSYENANWFGMLVHAVEGNGKNNYGYTWTYSAEGWNGVNVRCTDVSAVAYDGRVTPDEQLWAIVGNVWDGFKIYNKAAGQSMTLRKAENGRDCISQMSAETDRNVFKVYATSDSRLASNGFCFKIDGDGCFINSQWDGDEKNFKGWESNDAGSTSIALNPTVLPAGKYYRMKGYANNQYASVTSNTSKVTWVDNYEGANEASTIIYVTPERKLMSYNIGYFYHRGNSKPWFDKMAGNEGLKAYFKTGSQPNTIATNVPGVRNDNPVAEGSGGAQVDAWLHPNDNGFDRCSSDNGNDNAHAIYYEPVTALPVTIGSTGYATFYAPVAVNLPEGLKAYTVTLTQSGDRNLAEGTEITGAIPASTGVLLEGTAGETYSLELDYDNHTTAASALTGRYDTHNVAADVNAYVLAKPAAGNLAFYQVNRENDRTVKGGKAYLVIEGDAAGAPAFFLFSFGDLTGINGLETAGSAEGAAYDLSGRRVATPRKGLYIVGGKKVLVK